ncbi:Genetic suppressor element 1 [Acipenser ruthenus]|uniref:Genetic suppressor element 1 n=1 Tax=Acipenser ruthenus TaxID=7906 RepID=A0A444V307_ACIRT|nr:Genetic suppressor element 1 [Acipenser ruthenus]
MQCSGGSYEPMISPALKSTATVNPMTPSPPSLSSVSKRSLSVHGTPTAATGTHSASFAAALRKLAKQAEEPRAPSPLETPQPKVRTTLSGRIIKTLLHYRED